MKLEDIPDFAKPYKKRGFDVRHKGNAYQLFRISSKRVEGKTYPVLIQEYIGTIQPDGQLRRKSDATINSDHLQEFGLSDFLFKRYGRLLLRSIFNSSAEFARPIIQLAVLRYVHGCTSDVAIARCRLTASVADDLKTLRDSKHDLIERLSLKIHQEQERLFGESRSDFELLMRLCVIDSLSTATPSYPKDALQMLQRYEEKS